MRTHLNENTKQRLLEIMDFYGYTNPTHTLNKIIGSLHKSLFNNENPLKEVNTNGSQGESEE
ncbi:hypothetical protein D9M68_445800 [compost metagenome]